MKKYFTIIFLTAFFASLILFQFLNCSKKYHITNIISPVEIKLNRSDIFKIDDFETFDAEYTSHNETLRRKLGLTEDEAFIMGNLGKSWTKNLLNGKTLIIKNNDITYNKLSYKTIFENSPYCIKDGKPLNKDSFDKQLNIIRRAKYVILDLETDRYYPVSKSNRKNVTQYIVIRKSHIKKAKINKIQNTNSKQSFSAPNIKSFGSLKLNLENIKIILSDFTTQLNANRNCSSDICKEILENINLAKNTIDIAIYGYSSTPEIETAIQKAIDRGVQVRLVYDVDNKGENIYPNTFEFIQLIPDNVNDKRSSDVSSTMHNKFYIFDKKTVITGSANLSHTDMSGFNSNSIIVINSPQIAKFYEQEFEQMYSGNFHTSKLSFGAKKAENIRIFFSPQDKGIQNGILPLIKNAEKYIYIPAFIISDNRISQELINAKNRGVEVRIIVDALNASNTFSRHKDLRNAGIPVKTENWAGKMHSKTIIIDDKFLVIGSMNFSKTGEDKNDENMIILSNSEAAKFYRDFFLYQWNKIPEKWLKYNAKAEGVDSIGSCTDGIDNDYDGKTDKDDEACREVMSK